MARRLPSEKLDQLTVDRLAGVRGEWPLTATLQIQPATNRENGGDGVEVDAVEVKDSRRLILALSVSITLENWIN
jgi:hypothetical protein